MHKLSIPGATSPLAAWLYYLERLHHTTIELGLERVHKVASKLNLLKPAPFVFTVAGTNGKGTTCRLIEAILMNSGYKVGVYSSPHLIRYTERVRIQGHELTEQQHSVALSFVEEGRGEISLSYFEFGTLSALKLFQQAELDVVILEVGLGGRLDATNIVDNDVAIITSIALDHTDWLGDSREAIGREKAGIFRQSKLAVVGEIDIPVSIHNEARRIGVQYKAFNHSWFWQKNDHDWCWKNENIEYQALPMPHIPLQNAATAIAAISYSSLDVNESAIRSGLENAQLTGRFQVVSDNPRLILDVAHNPHAAAYLAQKLQELPKRNGKMRVVVGMLSDKDIEGTLAHLIPIIDVWYCAPLQGPRGTTIEQIAQYLTKPYCFDTVEAAWQQAMKEADSNDTIIVFGSFHTVALVIEAIDAGKVNG